MSFERGVVRSKADDEIFVGWASAPAVDRRFLLGAIPLALAAAGGAAYGRASLLDDPGAGVWLTSATHEITGVLADAPYPMIRMADPAAPFGMRTALIVSMGKCTSGLEFSDAVGAPATARGVLIERGGRQMLEVPLSTPKWLTPGGAVDGAALLADPPVQSLGPARLKGMIMDSKCFFGVMRPARGRTHKACAALCIRGGIPPSFWARTADGREAVLLMTDADGGPLREAILPLVADPVEAEGELVRVGDLVEFRAAADAYRRI